MANAAFVPLRIFSAFTMLEGAIDPKVIAQKARAMGFPAAGLCDRNGLYGAMPFSDHCLAAGVQPVVGTLLGIARPRASDAPASLPPAYDWLALFAQTETGYDHLCALVSAAHLDRPLEDPPHVTLEALAERSEGVIALTGAGDGALARLFAEGQHEAAHAYAERLRSLFPDRLFVEIARRGDPVEQAAEPHLIALADGLRLPLVATNPACFAEADFHAAHDVMLCIAGSVYVESADRQRSLPDAWIKPAHAMAELFADLPDALANTLVVAERCAVAAPRRKPILPNLAGDPEAEIAQLRRDAAKGLDARLAQLPGVDPEPYRARLDFELDVIVNMGFAGYFLIVADFIKWAKDQGIPVGPGRGSGAGSIVAWALTITNLDPLALGLLFERFLNPERVSMPDFDIDFCETRREEVIRYVQSRYGRDHVAQIITFGRLKARAVLKDTGRVLQMSYGQVDRLAKLIPNHPTEPWTLDRALNGVTELAQEYRNDVQVRRLFDLARKLEGLPRHSSTHAAGVVIGDRPLDRLVPLYRDPRSDMPVTQFDMKYVEAAGLVKFDFLGLKTLSVLHRAVELIAAREGHRIDLDALGWEDEAVYALLQRGDTVGVFQLESEGMRRTLAAVRPTSFGDIIALVSLYRPGPMDNIPMFGARKNGREPIEYPHPLLAGILAETYGIFVYQEQVMQAAQILAGYSLGEADLLRRAMGKKIKAEMDAQRARFVSGCAVHDIAPRKANELFDLIDKFAGYGFNKSHAAAYAVLSYQTAWLKTHYPADFYAASMAFDLSNTDKLCVFVEDARSDYGGQRAKVRVLPPCLNAGQADFSVETVAPDADSDADHGLVVRYALGALKGVGGAAMEQLVAERTAHGPFASLDDFAERVSPRLINRRQIEALAGGGAFDAIVANRGAVHAAAETLLAVAAAAEQARTSGQGGLFGEVGQTSAAVLLPKVEWSLNERMDAEKEAFGFYFSAHPVDRYAHVTAAHGVSSFAALCARTFTPGDRQGAMMAALVMDARKRVSARRRAYMTVAISDPSGQVLASCFDEGTCAQLEDAARTGACLLLSVELDKREEDENPRVTIRAAQKLETLATDARLVMTLTIDSETAFAPLAALMASAGEGRGEAMADLVLPHGISARLRLGRTYRLDRELARQIEGVPGITGVQLGPRG